MNFSLYRGKLHKVPDVPRRWPLSKPSMSLRVFQKAIAKRQEAVRRFHAQQLVKHDPAAGAAVEGSNAEVPGPPDARDAWNSSAIDGIKREQAEKRKREDAETLTSVENEATEKKTRASARSAEEDGENVVTDLSDLRTHTRISGPQDSRPQSEDAEPAHRSDHIANATAVADNGNDKEKEAERLEAPRTPAAKDEDCIKSAERVNAGLDGGLTACGLTTEGSSLTTWRAKRKAELEEKLKSLQETKHQLVQILKQVLISEEESKRKAQGLLHNSAGSATDQPTDQRIGSDVQLSGDLEEGEFECVHNHDLPVVGFNQGSHFSIAHPQPLGATHARHESSSQPSSKRI